MITPENSRIVIFGASGDLTYRKLIPALYHLFENNQMPFSFAILGASRTEYCNTVMILTGKNLKKHSLSWKKQILNHWHHFVNIYITKH